MSKPTLVVFPDLLKAHVDQYVRSDGTVVQAHDDKRVAANPNGYANKRVVAKLKTYHKASAAGLKSDLGSALSAGDTESDNGGHLTYGDVKKHLQTMRTQLNKDPVHAQHIEHAGYAVQQAFRHDAKPLEEKHAKLIGAALSGKTRIDDNGMVQHAPEPRLALPKKKAATPKTGSAAPARMTNVGSEKYPFLAKNSDKLAAKHDDGSTHHVGGFEPPSNGKGDHMVHHDGKLFSFTGKSGKNMKTGEASYEYSHKSDSGDRRAWVTHSGHLMND